MPKNPHEHDIEIVAAGLDHLLPQVVFVGGAVVGFYITDAAAPSVRGTDDIDCVLELHSYTSYSALEEELRELGFTNDTTEGAPTCRYLYQGYVVDIMPSDSNALGFANRWYPDGAKAPVSVTLPSSRTIQIMTIPYFIGCKFEAHSDRGAGDFVLSRDIQDIVAILDGHTDVEAELQAVSGELAAYLHEAFRSNFDVEAEDIVAHLSGENKTRRAERILNLIARLYGPLPSAIKRSSMFIGGFE